MAFVQGSVGQHKSKIGEGWQIAVLQPTSHFYTTNKDLALNLTIAYSSVWHNYFLKFEASDSVLKFGLDKAIF
jgi:hypothetical protein